MLAGAQELLEGVSKEEVRELLGITDEARDYTLDDFRRGVDPKGLKPDSALLVAIHRARVKLAVAPVGEKLKPDRLLFQELVQILNERGFSDFGPFTDFNDFGISSVRGHDPDEREISKEKRSRTSRKKETGIPKKAPRLWRGGHIEELNAADFVREVYGPAIESGMTQADLKRLDPKLYMAFHKWCGRNSVDTRSILPSSLSDADSVVATRGGRRPTRAEALAALRTGTEEGLRIFKAYESIGRRTRLRRSRKAALG